MSTILIRDNNTKIIEINIEDIKSIKPTITKEGYMNFLGIVLNNNKEYNLNSYYNPNLKEIYKNILKGFKIRECNG